MCRLYGLSATHPTRPACALLQAQNTRIEQRSTAGQSPIAGWGVGVGSRSGVRCWQQVRPADKSAQVRAEALSTRGTAILAATHSLPTGPPSVSDVQPFRDGNGMLVCDGELSSFADIRADVLHALTPARRQAIRGDTAGEHLFQLLRERDRQVPNRSMTGSLRAVLHNLNRWSDATGQSGPMSMSVLWAQNERLAGACCHRSLYVLTRSSPLRCSVCGRPHASHNSPTDYRAVVFASRPLTDEDWQRVPDRSLLAVDRQARLAVSSLDQPARSWLRTGSA